MSELLDKQLNPQKESLKKYFRGSCQLLQAHEKVCDENERNKQTKNKRCARKNVIDGRKHFIGRLHKTGEDDWDNLRDNDSRHDKGIIYLVNR